VTKIDFQPDGFDFQADSAPVASQEAAGAPRASQADVRAAEPPHTLAAQDAAERGYEAALREWMKTPTGTAYNRTGADVRKHFSRLTGRPDPRAGRERAKVQHAAETGEIVYEDNLAYQLGKPLASMAGFAFGGPAGATGAEAGVRALALTENLTLAVRHGAIDEERAQQIFIDEMKKGTVTDAAWNIGTPVAVDAVGWLLQKVPGATWLKGLADKAMGKKDMRAEKIAERAALAKTPAGAQAVKEVSRRIGPDQVLTPGQVTGQAPIGEIAARTAHPKVFTKGEEAVDTAVEGMRRDALYPGGQPKRKVLGERVVEAAEETARAVKDRLRPVFQEADNAGIAIDMSDVAKVADEALKKDSAVLGRGKLTETERAHLQSIVDGAKDWPTSSSEAALDFISVQKEKLRKLNQDGVPSKYFETVVGRLTRAADDAFTAAVRQGGRGDIVRKLELARQDYRHMSETIFDDAMKAALKKGGAGAPEDIGQYLWQNGKVSRIEQLDELLRLGQKEGAVSRAAAEKMQRDVTRGFLQEAVKNVDDAATFSKRLAEQPRLAETWEVLTAAPAGKQLKDVMSVLEEAAKIARNNNSKLADTLGVGAIPVARAARGGLGVSYVTGVLHPGMAVVGLSIDASTRMAATAYTHGNKGVLNSLVKVLRLRDAPTPAATQALRAALAEIEKFAVENGITDIFVGEEEPE
jgi:hypothetical protein